MTNDPGRPNETRPSLALALNLLASARRQAARHSITFGLCVVGPDGDVVLVACEDEAQSESAAAAAVGAITGRSDTSSGSSGSAGSVLPDLGSLGAAVSGAIGIVACGPLAREILDDTLTDLRDHVERFLRQ